MKLSQVLKEKRKEYQLTQEALAEKIFVSNKTISNWETGKTTPDLDSLIRLANLFDLSLDNLLLEGSEVVRNIKADMELKTLKEVSLASVLISVCLVVVLTISNLSILASVMMAILAFCNFLIAIYIDKRIKEVKTT